MDVPKEQRQTISSFPSLFWILIIEKNSLMAFHWINDEETVADDNL